MNKLFICRKIKHVKKLIQHCKKTRWASFDYETTSFNYYGLDDYPLIMGVSFQPGCSWIVPLAHKDSPFKKIWLKVFKLFARGVFEDPEIVKVAWNFKFEYKWTMQYDFKFKGRLFDGMLAKYCLDEEKPFGLKDFVRKMFPEFANYEDGIKDADGKGVDWKNKPFKELCEYCGIDSDLTLRGMIYMEPKLIRLGFYSLFRNMLMMITRVLAEAEFRGVLVDRKYLEGLMKEYAIKIDEATKEMQQDRKLLRYEKIQKQKHIQGLIDAVSDEIEQIREDEPANEELLIRNRENKIKAYQEGKFGKKETWEGINFGSPKQLSHFFFEAKHGLRIKPTEFTPTGNPATGEEVLLALGKKDKTGFMKKLIHLRGLEKLNSTYIAGVYPLLDHFDRVHASFLIHGTVTGRLSCKGPNLQNIPRGSTAADIKKMFIPPPGYLLLEVDYSQAELRIIAEVSGDTAMIEIFKKNYNIHVATACKMNGGLKQYDKVKGILKIAEAMDAKELEKPENEKYLFWVKQKKKGKSLNFSIVYQQGDKATAETLECTKEEAKQFKADWFAEFPQVKKWIDAQKRRAYRKGYVKNLFGGKRRLHNIDSSIDGQRFEAERQAVNAPIQGGSGYFTLFSMVVIREKILKGELPRDLLSVYTVHDSIGYYIRPKDIHWVVPEIVKICDNPETLKYFGFELKYVKMKVSPEIGKNWADLKDYDAWTDYTKWVA